MAPEKEMWEYRMYTTPSELHKAVNTLRGLVAGLSSNGAVTPAEMEELVYWCAGCEMLQDRHPFSELLPVIERSIADGVIDEEEKENILWLCNNFLDVEKYYDLNTASIQFLTGLVHGIMADGTLDDREIEALKLWISSNDYLMGTYPFDEINQILYSILEDHVITEDERNTLIAFVSNLIDFDNSINLNADDYAALREKYSMGGICEKNPVVEFAGNTFCFTGDSPRASRSVMTGIVEKFGGTVKSSVSKKLNYLVVGNDGNPCWAFSCYGRKVEAALAWKEKGAAIHIISEDHFWAAFDRCYDVIEESIQFEKTSDSTYNLSRIISPIPD